MERTSFLMDEKEKLMQARDHIIAARSILRTSEHPLAKAWLDKLEEVLETVPKPQPRPADKQRGRTRSQSSAQPRPAAAPRKQKRSATRTIIYMLFFIIVLGGLLIGAVTFLQNAEDSTATPTITPAPTLEGGSGPILDETETPTPSEDAAPDSTPADSENPASE